MMIMNTSEVWIAPANTVRMPLFSKTKAKKATTVVHHRVLGDPDRVRRQRQPLLLDCSTHGQGPAAEEQHGDDDDQREVRPRSRARCGSLEPVVTAFAEQ